MSLRDDVDKLLPGWESWYPSLFHAAEDLGLIRARVCSLSSLMLSQRHASVYNEAVQAFRQQWSVEDESGADTFPIAQARGNRHQHHNVIGDASTGDDGLDDGATSETSDQDDVSDE